MSLDFRKYHLTVKYLNMNLWQKKFFVIFFLLTYLNIPLVFGQELAIPNQAPKKPVMYSVFWNTLWGSAWGSTMGFSYHLISGIKLRESLITATTIGGILGYGLGIYLVINGLSFDESYLLELPTPKFQPQQNTAIFLKTEIIPLHSYSKNNHSNGWELPIFALRF